MRRAILLRLQPGESLESALDWEAAKSRFAAQPQLEDTDSDKQAYVASLLEGLTPQQLAVVEMHGMAGLSFRAVASIYNCGVDTVRRHWYTAVEQMTGVTPEPLQHEREYAQSRTKSQGKPAERSIRHGPWGYRKYKCRCEVCRAGHADELRKYRQKKSRQTP